MAMGNTAQAEMYSKDSVKRIKLNTPQSRWFLTDKNLFSQPCTQLLFPYLHGLYQTQTRKLWL